MSINRKDLKITIVGFTLLALLAFSYTQYRTYRDDIRTTREQLQLNTLHGKIVYLDEALTMSARWFVITKDTQWHQRYRELQHEFDGATAQIYKMMNGSFEGKKELEAGTAGLMALEEKALALARDNRFAEAKALLFSTAYANYQHVYQRGEDKLIIGLDKKMEELMILHRNNARHTALAEAVIALLLIVGWYSFSRVSRNWQHKINELNRQRAAEARQAAEQQSRMNDQLRQLSAHLQETREAERREVAHEINEEVGQQIAAVRIKLATLQRQAQNLSTAQVTELQQVSAQLYDALNFLRNLASGIYPLVLRDLGLVEALAWESERLCTASVTVAFVPEVDYVTVDTKIATTLFRSFQELIQSLLAGGAADIISTLRVETNQLVLEIYNDAEPAASQPHKSLEELAIRERLRSIQASTTISHSPENGNSVTITIPYTHHGQPFEIDY